MDKSLVTKFFGIDASYFCEEYIDLLEYLMSRKRFNDLMKSAGKDEDLYRSQVFDYYHVSCFADLYREKRYSIFDVAEMFKLTPVDISEEDMVEISQGILTIAKSPLYVQYIKKINDCYSKNVSRLIELSKDDDDKKVIVDVIDNLYKQILKLCDKLEN